MVKPYIDDEGVNKLTQAIFLTSLKEYRLNVRYLSRRKKALTKGYITAYLQARDVRSFFESKWGGAIYPLDDPKSLVRTLDKIDAEYGWKFPESSEHIADRLNKLIIKRNPLPSRLRHLMRSNAGYDVNINRFWYAALTWRELQCLAKLLDTSISYIVFGGDNDEREHKGNGTKTRS